MTSLSVPQNIRILKFLAIKSHKINQKKMEWMIKLLRRERRQRVS